MVLVFKEFRVWCDAQLQDIQDLQTDHLSREPSDRG